MGYYVDEYFPVAFIILVIVAIIWFICTTKIGGSGSNKKSRSNSKSGSNTQSKDFKDGHTKW